MTLAVWNITGLIAVAVFAICLFIFSIYGFTRNRYYQEFHKDELIKTTKTVNSKNSLYFTSGETTRFIKKYVLCKSGVDKYIICNYNKPYQKMVFFLLCYKGRCRKPFKVYTYAELRTGVASRVISIPKKTKCVNIIISEADNQMVNERIIKPISLKNIKVFSRLVGLFVFAGLYMVRHYLSGYILTSIFFETFLNSIENYGLILITIVISFLAKVITKRSMKKKMKKAANGGAIEYDFL